MIENPHLRSVAFLIGYLTWFVILVRLMFLATGVQTFDIATTVGVHVGLAFFLLILALIPYFIASARAKKFGGKISWSVVMNGATAIALVLSLGGFYGQLQSVKQAPTSRQAVQPQQPPVDPQVPSTPEGNTPTYSSPPTFESEGWTQESTGSTEAGPWLKSDPVGTRYDRRHDGTIYRYFPPGVRPSAEKANPFGLMDSTDRPPQ